MTVFSSTSLTTLTNRLSELVGNNTIFWEDLEKRDAINEAISLWQCLTGEWDRESFEQAVNGRYYTVPRQITAVTRVLYNGQALSPSSIAELDNYRPGWEDNSPGTPLYWAPIGIGEILLYPTPSSGVVTIQGLSENRWLVSGADYLQLGDNELVPLLLYGHHYLTFKEATAELGATTDNIGMLVRGAAGRNDEILGTRLYRKYEGVDKDESLRPVREGTEVIGVRKT